MEKPHKSIEEPAGLLQKRLRQEALEKRRTLTKQQRQEKDERITKRLLAHFCYREAENILCYVSYGTECDTFALIQTALAQGRRVFCPRVEGKEMNFYRIDSPEALHPGYHRILEPLGDTKPYGPDAERTLAIVPGCVFDRDGHRIGYGGGYYDRYFGRIPREKRPFLAGLCYACQITDRILPLAHDIPMDVVLTEEENGGKI